jgi:flagellin
MQTSLERLSSGLRINKAKDDAAGLAISDRMTAQIRGYDQAMRNTNDGISMLQTADGAMAEITNALQRMRELAVQASTGTVNTTDGASLKAEYTALKGTIDDIVADTKFNGTALLSGGSSIDIQTGINAADQTTITFADVSGLTGIGDDISTNAGAQAAITKLDADLDTVAGARADVGGAQSGLESRVRNMGSMVENLSAARSRVLDTDFAKETANLTRTQILQQAGTAMLAQANQLPQTVLSLL